MDMADISSESQWFKNDLLKFASQLQRWHKVNRWSEKRIYEYEKGVLCCFLIVRKLKHTLKICDMVKIRKYQVNIYKSMGSTVDYINSHKVDQLYNLDSPQSVERDLNFICNQIVHSFIFRIFLSAAIGDSFVLVSSDERRNKELYGFSASVIVEILEAFGHCYPSKLSLTRIRDTNGTLTGKMKSRVECDNPRGCELPDKS